MFDIGFFELMVIGVIALLVLGPERLPHAIRMTTAWMGKFRRAAMSVREEIEREVNAMEVQQRIKEQLDSSGVNDAKDMLEETKQTLRNGILDEETLKEIEKRGLQDYAKQLIEPNEAETNKNSTPDTKAIEENPHGETLDESSSATPNKNTPNSTERPA